MQRIEQGGYTRQQILDQLHFRYGSIVMKFRYDLLDKFDRKKTTLKNVVDGEISMASLAEIKRIARLTIKDDNIIDWLNDRIQPFFMLRINKDWLEWPLGIFLLSSPTRKDEIVIIREVEAYDKTQIIKDDKFTERYTIKAGTNYVTAVKTIIIGTGQTKINVENTNKVLSTDREFEIGTEKLSAVNSLLNEINYMPIIADENGYFVSSSYRSPSERASEYTYKDNSMSILNTGISEKLDIFNIPNKWVVVASNPETEPLVSVYENNNPDSITSTVSRGRTIVDYREIDNIADQASLDAYVQRIAFNASQVYGHIVFETALMPHHSYADVLTLEYSRLGISDKYSETNWTMPLQVGAMMRHEVRKVINI